jgi:hypothetical protein
MASWFRREKPSNAPSRQDDSGSGFSTWMTSLIGFNPSISIHRHQDIWSLCVLDFYRYAGANLIVAVPRRSLRQRQWCRTVHNATLCWVRWCPVSRAGRPATTDRCKSDAIKLIGASPTQLRSCDYGVAIHIGPEPPIAVPKGRSEGRLASCRFISRAQTPLRMRFRLA